MLNIFKDYKEYYYGSENRYRLSIALEKLGVFTCTFLYILILISLFIYLINSLDTDSFKQSSFLVVMFSFFTALYIKINLEQSDEVIGMSIKWVFSLLLLSVVANFINNYILNLFLTTVLSLSLIFYNFFYFKYKADEYKEKVKNKIILKNYFLVEGMSSLYFLFNWIGDKLHLLVSIIFILIVGKLKEEKVKKVMSIAGSFIDSTLDLKTDKKFFFNRKITSIKLAVFISQLEDKKTREAYFLFLYIFTNLNRYDFEIIKEKYSNELESIRVRYNFFINNIIKEKAGNLSSRSSIGYSNIFYYNSSSQTIVETEGINIDDVTLELKIIWKKLKELEPNIFEYIFNNEENIYPFLCLQDFNLTKNELDYIQSFHAILQKSKNSKKINNKIYQLRLKYFNLIERYGHLKIISKKKGLFNNYLQQFKNNIYKEGPQYVNGLTLGIMWVFEEMIEIDMEIVKEKDMLLLWDIKKEIEEQYLINNNLLIQNDEGFTYHKVLKELYQPKLWNIFHTYQEMNNDLAVLKSNDEEILSKPIIKF